MADTDRNDYATPTLMRLARGVYAQAIRAELDLAGIDDLPANGVFILAGIDASGGPRQDLPAELGVTKQAVSQAIDILVNRGYLTREPDPADRRRVTLDLTDRARKVVDAAIRGVDAVNHQLSERVSDEQIDAMRAALVALTEIKGERIRAGTGHRRAARRLRRFSPIFGVRDLDAALAHYAALGFRTVPYPGGGYGFATRDGVELHLGTGPDQHPASAYLFVDDADALYQEWSRPGLGGHTHAPEPTPWRMHEGSHVDPDGNVIRFGSPLGE